MSARLELVRDDDLTFLRRWGWECRWFGGFIHKIEAPDPGLDLHGHPWEFGSLILKGSYVEERSGTIWACLHAEHYPRGPRGERITRKRWSWKALHLDECHRIISVDGPVWTLVLRGPKKAEWGFFTLRGFVTGPDYHGALRNELSEAA